MVIMVFAAADGGAAAPAGLAGAAVGAWAACCAITDVERSSRLPATVAALAANRSLTIDEHRVRCPPSRDGPAVPARCQVDDRHVVAEAVGDIKVLVDRALGDVPGTAADQDVALDLVGGNVDEG